jgi:dipeptidyl aminopeptidase/acylaminoacyl peptidase
MRRTSPRTSSTTSKAGTCATPRRRRGEGVTDWRSPVLLIHGDDDRNVPFSETVSLVAALREQGNEPEQLILPDEVHDLLLYGSWLRSYRAAAELLERRLGRP